MAAAHQILEITSITAKREMIAEEHTTGQDSAETKNIDLESALYPGSIYPMNQVEGVSNLTKSNCTTQQKQDDDTYYLLKAIEKHTCKKKTSVNIKAACSKNETDVKEKISFTGSVSSIVLRKVKIVDLKRAWEKCTIGKNICDPNKAFLDLCLNILTKCVQPLIEDPGTIMLEGFSLSEIPLRDFGIKHFYTNIFIYEGVLVLKAFVEIFHFSGTTCKFPPDIELLPEKCFNSIKNKYINIEVDVIKEIEAKKLPKSPQDVPAIMDYLWDHVKECVNMLLFWAEYLVESCRKIKLPMTGYHTKKCLVRMRCFNEKLQQYAQDTMTDCMKFRQNKFVNQILYIIDVIKQNGLLCKELFTSLQTVTTTKKAIGETKNEPEIKSYEIATDQNSVEPKKDEYIAADLLTVEPKKKDEYIAADLLTVEPEKNDDDTAVDFYKVYPKKNEDNIAVDLYTVKPEKKDDISVDYYTAEPEKQEKVTFGQFSVDSKKIVKESELCQDIVQPIKQSVRITGNKFMKKISKQKAQDKVETVETAQDKVETVETAQDKVETVETAQDKVETVDTVQDKVETVDTAQDTVKTAEEILFDQVLAESKKNVQESASCQDFPLKQIELVSQNNNCIRKSKEVDDKYYLSEAFEKYTLAGKTSVDNKGMCFKDDDKKKESSARADTTYSRGKVDIVRVTKAWEKYVVDKINRNSYEKYDLYPLNNLDLPGIADFFNISDKIQAKYIDPLVNHKTLMLDQFNSDESPLRNFGIKQLFENLSIYKRVLVVKAFAEVYHFSGTLFEFPKELNLLPARYINTMKNKYKHILVDIKKEIEARNLPKSSLEVSEIMDYLWAHAKECAYMLVFWAEYLVESCRKIKLPMTGYQTEKYIENIMCFYDVLYQYARKIRFCSNVPERPLASEMDYIIGVMKQNCLLCNEVLQSVKNLNTFKSQWYRLQN